MLTNRGSVWRNIDIREPIGRRVWQPRTISNSHKGKVDRSHINALIKHTTKMTVLQGPFAGMQLSERISRSDGDIAPKLLGTYEQELHPFFERMRTRSYDAVIDVGCAEGYLAVGCALLFPRVPVVYAFDSNPLALEISRENAVLNGVSGRVVTEGHCDAVKLSQLARAHPRALAILDCEGYEKQLFSGDEISGWVGLDFIIECHDGFVPNVTPHLVSKLFASHQLQLIYASGRNPNAFPFLSHLSDFDRWMAVCEMRPWLMHWLVCDSKVAA
jgi:SAM-dependent methyltransferase